MATKRTLTLLLTILAGSLTLFCRYDFQPLLSPGDHGRDLYAFEAALRGEAPYRDYWWVYGPLMPSYYSLFFKFLGTTIPSILIGKIVLNIFSGVFLYLTLATVTSLPFAFLGALWFWAFNPGFFFTYNHAGAITALMFIVYMLFLYLRDQRLSYLSGGVLGAAVLSLIKINFGLSSLFVFVFSVFLIDRLNKTPLTRQKQLFYIFALFLLPPMIFVTYYSYVFDFPFYQLRQCFPYLKADQQYYISVISGVGSWFTMLFKNIISSPTNFIFAVIVTLSTAETLRYIFIKPGNAEDKRRVLLAVIIPALFYVANLQEFIRSGVTYRTHWSTPFSILLIFIVISQAIKHLNRTIQLLLFGAIILIAGSTVTWQLQQVVLTRIPDNYLAHPRGQVYIGNGPAWIDTVQRTAGWLDANLAEDETFFAFPYDPIYYYLAGRKSPTRQLIFFNHINVPPEQEQKTIAELEKNNVNYVLLSTRMNSAEPSLGYFGVTYCPVLRKYIEDHFTEVGRWGDWQNEPGWAWNHGTMILKRK